MFGPAVIGRMTRLHKRTGTGYTLHWTGTQAASIQAVKDRGHPAMQSAWHTQGRTRVAIDAPAEDDKFDATLMAPVPAPSEGNRRSKPGSPDRCQGLNAACSEFRRVLDPVCIDLPGDPLQCL